MPSSTLWRGSRSKYGMSSYTATKWGGTNYRQKSRRSARSRRKQKKQRQREETQYRNSKSNGKRRAHDNVSSFSNDILWEFDSSLGSSSSSTASRNKRKRRSQWQTKGHGDEVELKSSTARSIFLAAKWGCGVNYDQPPKTPDGDCEQHQWWHDGAQFGSSITRKRLEFAERRSNEFRWAMATQKPDKTMARD